MIKTSRFELLFFIFLDVALGGAFGSDSSSFIVIIIRLHAHTHSTNGIILVVDSVFNSVVVACSGSLSLLFFKSILLVFIVVVSHRVNLVYIKCINNGKNGVINK